MERERKEFEIRYQKLETFGQITNIMTLKCDVNDWEMQVRFSRKRPLGLQYLLGHKQ